ncbi:MAG: hypothetical protein HY917_00670 [Candidatus Diapherotrites archaeon]|nr:hypothetical protein [Candidatus Diapherotrites archaeon]
MAPISAGSPHPWFLLSAAYRPARQEVVVVFGFEGERRVERFSFFPKAFVPRHWVKRAKELLPEFAKSVGLVERERSLEVRAVSWDFLQAFVRKLDADYPLVDTVRQFLVERGWGFGDLFSGEQNEWVCRGLVEFPRVQWDGVGSLESRVNDLLGLGEAEAGAFLHSLVWANRLRVLPADGVDEPFVRFELWLQNVLFAQGLAWPKFESDGVEEEFGVTSGELVWSVEEVKSFLERGSSVGFETLNCSCCVPVSLDSSGLVMGGLVEAELLADGLMVSSQSDSFAWTFHAQQASGGVARQQFAWQWGLKVPPVGPFSRGQRAWLPLNDARKLAGAGQARVLFSSAHLHWFCSKRESSLGLALGSLADSWEWAGRNQRHLEAEAVKREGVLFGSLLAVSPEYGFWGALKSVNESLLGGILVHLHSSFSAFRVPAVVNALDELLPVLEKPLAVARALGERSF